MNQWINGSIGANVPRQQRFQRARYVGAYRFRNGDYIVIDRFPNTQDTLWVTDVKSGQARTIFAIKQILDQAGRRDYTVKVYPNGSHNLMEVPPDNTDEYVRLKRFPPGFFETMVDWTTTQLRRRAPVRR